MRDDGGDLLSITAADATHLFDQLVPGSHEPRVEGVAFFEPLEVGHPHALVQVVRARLQDVAPRPGRLARADGFERGIEERPLEPAQQIVDRFAVAEREACAGAVSRMRRRAKRLWRASEDELPRGEVVEGTAVDPEELRVADDLAERGLVHGVRVRHDLFEHLPHLEAVRVALVIEDVATGQRGVVEVPGEDLLPERQRPEAVGIELDDGGLTDAFEQVDAIRHQQRLSAYGSRLSAVPERQARTGSAQRATVRSARATLRA